MTDKPHNKGKNKPSNTTHPTSANKTKDSKDESISTEQKQNPTNENNQSPKDIAPLNKDNWEKRTYNWNMASVIINGLMMLFTAFLFWQSKEGIKAAVNSATIADSTLTEVRKQFEILNRPILQIGDIALAKFKAGEKPVIIYKMENVGNYAAKVLTRKVKLGYVHDIKERGNDSGWVKIEIPTYVTKETPFTENLFIEEILEKEYYDAASNGVLKILAIGEIEYINEVTNENWIFEFAIEIKPPPSKDFIIRVANNKKLQIAN